MGRTPPIIKLDEANLAHLNMAIDALWTEFDKVNSTQKETTGAINTVIAQQTQVSVGGDTSSVQDTIKSEDTFPSMYNYTPLATGLNYGRLLVGWETWPGITDEGVTGYDVFCSADSGCSAIDENCFTVGCSGTTYLISGLTPGLTYYVRVRPRTADGIGVESSVSSALLSATLGVTESTTAPTDSGDMKIITAASGVISACDSASGWAEVSGGPTIALDTTNKYQGTGCIKVTVPRFGTVIVKHTFSSTDLSSANFIKLYLKADYWSTVYLSDFSIYFGEAAYNENTLAINKPTTSWQSYFFNISSLAAASRDGVTLFAIGCKSAYGSPTSFYIDYVFYSGDPQLIANLSGTNVNLFIPEGVGGTTLANNIEYINSADAKTTDSSSWTTLKEAKIYNKGTYTIKFDTYRTAGAAGGESQIFVNDVATGVLRSLTGSAVTFSEDLSLGSNDVVRVKSKCTLTATTVRVDDFKVQGTPAHAILTVA